MGWGMVPWASIIDNNTDTMTNQNGTTVSQKKISQEGVDKIIYDVLSSDSGLASLANGENGSGGFNSSTKGLMAQDLAVKLAGEIANVTAETTSTTVSSSVQDKQSPVGKGLGTIICTHMMNIGLLDRETWKAGHPYTLSLHARTIAGYHFWAEPIVEKMKANPMGWRVSFWNYMVQKRYQFIVGKKWNLAGAFGVYVMQPVSYVIGYLIGVPNGRYASSNI